MKPKIIEMKKPSKEDIKSFYSGIVYPGIIDSMAAYIDGKVVGIAGTILDPTYDGTLLDYKARVIGFIDANPEAKCLGVNAILAIREFIRSKGRELYVQCDANNYPDAPRLLTVLGFKMTDEVQRDSRNSNKLMQVWKWQQ